MHRLSRTRSLATRRRWLTNPKLSTTTTSNFGPCHLSNTNPAANTNNSTTILAASLSTTSCSLDTPFRPTKGLHYPRWSNHPNSNNGNRNPNNNNNNENDKDNNDNNKRPPSQENPENTQQKIEKSDKSKTNVNDKSSNSERTASSSSSSSPSSSSSSPPPPASGSSGSSSSGNNNGSSSSSSSSAPNSSTTQISKPTVPEYYPQVLGLPINGRPLFPGFYKAVVIRNPAVMAAIKDMMKRGQPYLGAFLLKEEYNDADTIHDLNAVHDVGVFAQITSIFNTASEKEGDESSLTAVLYPHRRIRITNLIPPKDDDPTKVHVHTVAEHTGPDNIVSSTTTTTTTPENTKPIVEQQKDQKPDQQKQAEKKSPPSQDKEQEQEHKQEQEREQEQEQKVEKVKEQQKQEVQQQQKPTDDKDVEKQQKQDSKSTTKDSVSKHPPPFQTSFLHNYNVSLVDVENLQLTSSFSIPQFAGEDASTSTSSDSSSTSSSPTAEARKSKQPSQYVRAVASEIISVFKDIASLNPLFRDQIATFSMSQGAGNIFEQPEKLADFAAAVSSGETAELQEILECMVLEERMQKALVVLKKELMNAQLQSKISREVEGKIQKRQREYYLMEQLKGIKKELGLESDGKDKMVEKFMDRAKTLKMPENVRTVFDEEINKLEHLEPAASEFNVTRNYLDWLTSIPWGKYSDENYNIPSAVKILDEDHYGLKDVKDRILEFLAVGKLRGTVEGKILCLVGPPGVGKTSIGKSIARALSREFFRFSVGGLSDVAEIKGHRRTYVGAMPGKIVQALKRVQVQNFLCLIDEIDKLNRGINGDPASALLEMLDPEQNNAFLDHYVDCPIDLSRVLFVCTANSLDTIPPPLLDRMEVLDVSGYVQEEKAAIATQYLVPQAKEASGLKEAHVDLTKEAIDMLIRYYCRESGVRKLKQHIEKVYRKAALDIVKKVSPKEEETENEKGKEDSAAATTETEEQKQQETTQSETQTESDTSTSPSSSYEQAPAKEEGSTTEPTESSENSSDSSSATKPDEPSSVTSTHEPTSKDKDVQVRKPLDVPESVSLTIDAENLADYVGPPVYQKDRMYLHFGPPGVSMGLGYLGNGSGSVMPIEAAAMPGSGNIQLTGKLGEVIRESAQIGLSFLKTHAYTLGLTEKETDDLVGQKNVHLHMPEGAVGKEGPSAGTAILTAFVSLFSKTGISSELAMTGEMTLAGQVLAIGGCKEKLLAARRAGVKTVLVPMANKADIVYNVPDSVKEGLEIIYVEDVREVLRIAFTGRNDDLVKRLDNLPLVPREETVGQ